MKIMGLDLGTRTCGIALSDINGIIAYGALNYRFKDSDYPSLLAFLDNYIKEQRVEEIVIGLPRHMNGDISTMGEIVLKFKDELAQLSGLRVETIDERLTTVIANKRLLDADLSRKKRKEVIDKMAAVVILQNYLDRKKNKGE